MPPGERSSLVADGAGRWIGPSAIVERFEPSDGEPGGDGRWIGALMAQLAERSFPVGELLLETNRWAVSTRPSGHPADRPDLHADPDDLVVAVGAGLRQLHALSATDAPAAAERGSGWDAIAESCRTAVAAPGFHVAALPAPYDRYDGPTLLAMMLDGRPGAEEAVCCHGRPTLRRFMVDGGRFTGFQGLADVVVADRHLDLAVIHQSVHHELGPEAVFRFYQAYGADPDLVRLDHYVLVSHLLGTSPLDAAQQEPAPSSSDAPRW